MTRTIENVEQRRDAGSSFRGYRLQLLYTLWRVLEEPANRAVKLEGLEDLDVLDSSGALLEAVQVKAYRKPLTLSDLQKNSAGATSLDARVRQIRRTAPSGVLRIVSFSGYGDELREAWDGDKKQQLAVQSKLSSLASEVSPFEAIALDVTSEDVLRSAVFAHLQDSLAGADFESATELLLFWLFIRAEARATISRAALLNRLEGVGRFVNARTARALEWFVSILPIEDPITSPPAGLAEQFQNGVSVRYPHVVAGLDVNRPGKLRAIHDAFTTSNVVVVHGASGQGKSCLAYRYLHDFVPGLLRYEVGPLAGLEQAQRVATVLVDHIRHAQLPIFIYIDVGPGDESWVTIVERLTTWPNVHVLVTIREEDWARGRPVGARVSFADIELLFDKTEAQMLFDAFTAQGQLEFVDFADAWRMFGAGGPLLEFTYILLHHETLHQRLRQQTATLLNELQAQELLFVRAILSAGEYGCQLDLSRLLATVPLPRPQTTIARLEAEYLIRRDDAGANIEGLHPVRSSIAQSFLSDPIISPWQVSARTALAALPESQLERFLFETLAKHPEDASALVEHARTMRLHKWSGAAAVIRALIWMTIRKLVLESSPILDKGKRQLPGLWKFVLPSAMVAHDPNAPDFWLDLLQHFRGAREIGLALRAEMPRAEFTAARNAIRDAMATRLDTPTTAEEWAALAEVVFWCGHWSIENAGASVEELRAGNLSSMPLSLALDVGHSLLSSMPHSRGAAEVFQILLARFRHECNVVRIEISESLVRSDFLIANPQYVKFGTAVDDETTLQLRGLRALFPHAESYGCKGFGGISFGRYDDSEKTAVARYLLPPSWIVHYNRVARNLALAADRPQSWPEYIDVVFDMRRRVVAAMRDVEMLLVEHFSGKETLPPEKLAAIDSHRASITTDLQLPLSAVDPWGFASEGDKGDATTDRILTRRQVPWKYERHVNKLESYLMHATSFLQSASGALAYKSYTLRGTRKRRQAAQQLLRSQEMGKAREQIGWTLEDCVAMQRAVREELGRFGNSEEAVVLEKEELRTIRRVWELWLALELPVSAGADATRHVELWLDNRIQKLQRKLSNHAAASAVHIALREAKNPAEEDLWIVVEMANPLEFVRTLERIKRAISQVLYDQSPIARACYRQRWNALHIVPILKGRTVLHIALQAHMASYCLGRIVNFLPDQVADEMLASFGIQHWASEVACQVEVLWTATQRLKHSLERLIEVDSAPCDGDARAVAEAYRWRWHDEWCTEAAKAVNAAEWLAVASHWECALPPGIEAGDVRSMFLNFVEVLNGLSSLRPTEFQALDLKDSVGALVDQVDVLALQLIIYLSDRDAAPLSASTSI